MRYLRPDSRELAVEFSIKTLSPGKAKTGCLVLGVYRGARGAELTRAAQLAHRAPPGAPRGAVPPPPAATAPLREARREAVATADGAALARTLGNLPSNICTPAYLAEEARKLARQFKLAIEEIGRASCRER